jgi:PhnB protein
MTMARANPNDETQIRALIDDWTGAIRAKDVRGARAPYAPDVVVCDLAPPLWRVGSETLKKSFEAWFPTWDGPIGFEIRDLRVACGGDIAFGHGLQRISGTKTDGEKPDIWVRATLCFRKVDGQWRIAHEHTSVPFYMDGSYKAAVDLKP